MTILRLAAPLFLFAACCAPAWSYASVLIAQSPQQNTLAPEPATAQEAQFNAHPSDRPILAVGVSDPNTQLILPWFLTDVINAVNSRSSFSNRMLTPNHTL
jgi:hypothetical protein